MLLTAAAAGLPRLCAACVAAMLPSMQMCQHPPTRVLNKHQDCAQEGRESGVRASWASSQALSSAAVSPSSSYSHTLWGGLGLCSALTRMRRCMRHKPARPVCSMAARAANPSVSLLVCRAELMPSWPSWPRAGGACWAAAPGCRCARRQCCTLLLSCDWVQLRDGAAVWGLSLAALAKLRNPAALSRRPVLRAQVAQTRWQLTSAGSLLSRILEREGRATDGSVPVGPKALRALLADLQNAEGPASLLAGVPPAGPVPLAEGRGPLAGPGRPAAPAASGAATPTVAGFAAQSQPALAPDPCAAAPHSAPSGDQPGTSTSSPLPLLPPGAVSGMGAKGVEGASVAAAAPASLALPLAVGESGLLAGVSLREGAAALNSACPSFGRLRFAPFMPPACH